MRKWTMAVALILLTAGSSYAGPFGLFGRNRTGWSTAHTYQATYTVGYAAPAADCGGCNACGVTQTIPVQWQGGYQACVGGCAPTTTWTLPAQQQQLPIMAPAPNLQPPANAPRQMPAGVGTLAGR
jgi:hypothetical protein